MAYSRRRGKTKRSRKYRGRKVTTKRIRRIAKRAVMALTDLKRSIVHLSYSPTQTSFSQLIAWRPIDPPISQGATVTRVTQTPDVEKSWGLPGFVQRYNQATDSVPFLIGTSILRTGVDIRGVLKGGIFTGLGAPFAVANPDAAYTSQNPRRFTHRVRLSIVRAVKGMSDRTLEAEYLSELAAGVRFYDPWDKQAVQVVYDRIYTQNWNTANGHNIRIKLKGKRGKQRLRFIMSPDDGAQEYQWLDDRAMMLVIRFDDWYTWTVGGTTYRFSSFIDNLDITTYYCDI